MTKDTEEVDALSVMNDEELKKKYFSEHAKELDDSVITAKQFKRLLRTERKKWSKQNISALCVQLWRNEKGEVISAL